MRYYRCKCGKREAWSSRGVAPCKGCESCGTTLADVPGGHGTIQEHKWDKPRWQINPDTGERWQTRQCFRCLTERQEGGSAVETELHDTLAALTAMQRRAEKAEWEGGKVHTACMTACPDNGPEVGDDERDLLRYVLLDEDGEPLINTDFPAEVIEGLARLLLPLHTANARLRGELRIIAEARTATWDDPADFEAWAKSRARHALRAAGGSDG